MTWVPLYAVLLLVSTIATYLTAQWMPPPNKTITKNLNFLTSLAINFGMLTVFKYYNFFSENLNSLLGSLHLNSNIPVVDLILPMGISFHTFQAVGYSLEVYKGRLEPEKHLGVFALYSCFFPQLVAGPIERPNHLLPQLHKKFNFDCTRIFNGLKRMAWGFFLKLVIADNLAIFVNKVYTNPQNFSGTPLILATYFFAFQIYCDFAGYTEIAIGSAHVMGFELMENFNRPYFSKSISEFWRRWHISLSTWFRDYLYIPLGGNRGSTLGNAVNVMVVFLLCGLWHGAKWTFVVWGGLHGLYIVSSVLIKRAGGVVSSATTKHNNFYLAVSQYLTTFSLVCFSWIFFRANTLNDAWYIITHLFSNLPDGLPKEENIPRLILNLILIFFLLAVQLAQEKNWPRASFFTKLRPYRFAGYATLLMAIWFLGEFSNSDFLYFKF